MAPRTERQVGGDHSGLRPGERAPFRSGRALPGRRPVRCLARVGDWPAAASPL